MLLAGNKAKHIFAWQFLYKAIDHEKIPGELATWKISEKIDYTKNQVFH